MEAIQLSDLPKDKEKRQKFLDQKAEQVAESKKEELLVDFDEAYQEYKNKEVPLVVRFMGEKFEVPRKRPVGVTVWTARKQTEGAISDDQYYTLLQKIFGERFIQKMEECDAPLEFVTKNVMEPLYKKWGVKGGQYKKK